MRRLTKSDAERFWTKVDKTPGHGPNGDCWLWTASQRSDRYGVFGLDGVRAAAHRVAFRLAGGKLKPGHVVMHTCDVRLCCNPAHLRLGTQHDNVRDAVAKGLMRRGGRSIPLTDAEILQIHEEYERGLSRPTLAKKWQLAPATVMRVLRRAKPGTAKKANDAEAHVIALREIRIAAQRILEAAAPGSGTESSD
jgi:hypothetical protein